MTKSVKVKGHRKSLLKALNPTCGICTQPIVAPDTATIDHILPLSLGGSNHRENVQLAHPKCNRRKGNDPEFVPINLRKKRCPHCHKWFKSVPRHVEAKHQVTDLVKKDEV